MLNNTFNLKSPFAPAGDQPKAIKALVDGFRGGYREQTLLGVTGSGKTFSVANVIEALQKPTLVIAHNKTLAAQLAQEYKEFFPENAVHYFVSYYDFYQPEAYLPSTDTYIEKEAQINEEIDRLRHASTQALLTRKDVIVVASVSAIYGLGSPAEYEKVNRRIEKGMKLSRNEMMRALVSIHYNRTNADLAPGLFRGVGNVVEIMPVSERTLYRIEFSGDIISGISAIDPVSRRIIREENVIFIFPAKHFITDKEQLTRAISTIKSELEERLAQLEKRRNVLEAERLRRRTRYDLALIREVGYCNGIENYSRHFSGKSPGEPPDTLLSYFPHGKDGSPEFLTVIDESHVTVPQIRGMFAGDASRKKTLIEHGFRLPSAADNRPLTFKEFEERVGQTLYTSATPAPFELQRSKRVVEQVIRPTGLLDPLIVVRPVIEKGKYKGQVQDLIGEIEKTVGAGGRVIATTLTKKMAEDLSEFLKERNIKAEYLHSGIKTIERIQILSRFRTGGKDGGFDCVVGVNLLREGLDLPEVELIGILDADREGFLRSETSLIQTIGRAARNEVGRVILYADRVTGSMERAISETGRRRALQIAHNTAHGITPKTISKKIHDITESMESTHSRAVETILRIDEKRAAKNPDALIAEKVRQMNAAVKELDFESAAILRDEIKFLEKARAVSSSAPGMPQKPKKARPRR